MSNSVDAIVKVETFIISIPREVPYLGPLKEGERINERGYLVRKGNRTIYPSTDMTLLIKVTGESGLVGWGECYGIVAPEATKAIIDDVLGPVIIGRDPADAVVIHEDLYDLMRVRGFFGGYYVDALAGVDIALWDLAGKNLGVSVSTLLGGRRHSTTAGLCFGPAARHPAGALRSCRRVGQEGLSRHQVRCRGVGRRHRAAKCRPCARRWGRTSTSWSTCTGSSRRPRPCA